MARAKRAKNKQTTTKTKTRSILRNFFMARAKRLLMPPCRLKAKICAGLASGYNAAFMATMDVDIAGCFYT